MNKKILIFAICVIMSLFISPIVEAAQTISIKGFAYSIEQPDIAHITIKISGEGNNYKESSNQADNNINEIMKLSKELLGTDISPQIIKTESKVKPPFDPEDYEQYTQDYLIKMAKAMKGEIPTKTETPEEEMYITTKFIYFSINNYSIEQLNNFRNTLASKKLAFNEKSSFDFYPTFDLNRSNILYGVSDPYKYYGKLSKAAYENAKLKGKEMTQAIDMELGKLISVEKGCNKDIEGGVDISELKKLLGKQLGPASSDPKKLPLKFNSKFIFKIK